MKFCLLIIALCGVASGSPVPHAVDWAGIEENLGIIKNGTFTTGIAEMKEVATSDNVEVGQLLAVKLDAAAAQVEAILDELSVAIQDRNLTSTDADLICGNYSTFIEHESITFEIDLLSSAARMEVLYALYVPGHFDIYKCHEILWLLDERPLIPTNWTLLDLELTHLASRVDDGAAYVKEVALEDVSEVGERISPVVDAAAEDVKAFIEETRAKITNQTLSLQETINYTKEIYSKTYDLLMDIYDDVAELSFFAFFYIQTAFQLGMQETYYSGAKVGNAIAGGLVIPESPE